MAEQNSKITLEDVESFFKNFPKTKDLEPEDYFTELHDKQREAHIRIGFKNMYCPFSAQCKIDPNLPETSRKERETYMWTASTFLSLPEDVRNVLANSVFKNVAFHEARSFSRRKPRDDEVFSENGYNEDFEYFVEKDEMTDWDELTLLWSQISRNHPCLLLIRGRRRIADALTCLAQELELSSPVQKYTLKRIKEISSHSKSKSQSQTTPQNSEKGENIVYERKPRFDDVERGIQSEAERNETISLKTKIIPQPKSEIGLESDAINIKKGNLNSNSNLMKDKFYSLIVACTCSLIATISGTLCFLYFIKYISNL